MGLRVYRSGCEVALEACIGCEVALEVVTLEVVTLAVTLALEVTLMGFLRMMV